MPTTPPRARHLLKSKQAKVVRREPFTIKLLHGASGYRQEIVAGMDTGSKALGCAAIANGNVLYEKNIAIWNDENLIEINGSLKVRAPTSNHERIRCRTIAEEFFSESMM